MSLHMFHLITFTFVLLLVSGCRLWELRGRFKYGLLIALELRNKHMKKVFN